MGAAARPRAAERQRLAREWNDASDDASDDDKAWFAANQLRTTRIRHATPAELEINARELRRSMSPGSGRRWFTLVRQVVPGLRFRIFATNVADALTDEVHEAVAAQAYDATLAERSGGENLVTLERDLRADLSNANWTRH